jgi:hypothetical protein
MADWVRGALMPGAIKPFAALLYRKAAAALTKLRCDR